MPIASEWKLKKAVIPIIVAFRDYIYVDVMILVGEIMLTSTQAKKEGIVEMTFHEFLEHEPEKRAQILDNPFKHLKNAVIRYATMNNLLDKVFLVIDPVKIWIGYRAGSLKNRK